MKRLITTPLAAMLFFLSPLAQSAPEKAVQVSKIEGGGSGEVNSQTLTASVTLVIRDLGPVKDVGIYVNTEQGEVYRPGVYIGTAEYGYEIWKVETDVPDNESMTFLGIHRVGNATYIDDNDGAFYSYVPAKEANSVDQ